MATRMNYEAPTVSFLKFNANDVLRTSPAHWDFTCTTTGEGDNAAPPNCDLTVTTDNSQN